MKTLGINNKMKANDLLERTIVYSRRVIKAYRDLEKDGVGRILGRQLVRSATSIGANLHEAQGGQTRPDFISKISIAQKEALETVYWLKVLEGENIVSGVVLKELLDEASQLSPILAKISVTSKKNLSQQ